MGFDVKILPQRERGDFLFWKSAKCMWGKYGGRALFDRKTIRFAAVRDKKSLARSETGGKTGLKT